MTDLQSEKEPDGSRRGPQVHKLVGPPTERENRRLLLEEISQVLLTASNEKKGRRAVVDNEHKLHCRIRSRGNSTPSSRKGRTGSIKKKRFPEERK